MKNKIILLTGYSHFFGQTRKPWVSINTDLLVQILEKHGLDVEEHDFHEIVNKSLLWEDSIIFYTFSQRENLRNYIKDIVFTLQKHNNQVIPSLELLLCHENKGYQECLKQILQIDNLPAYYFSSKRELTNYNLDFPYVLKTIEGSNGKGVFLVKNINELLKTIAQIEPRMSLNDRLDLLRRKYLRVAKSFPGYDSFDNRKDLTQYSDYIKQEKCFVLQKFIPDLQFDYRVIIMGEHYYVTKRLVRSHDFRASGAKRFTFDFQASDALLDFARSIYNKFQSPCLSIDVGEANGEFYLFEFQALHFGINAIVRGKGYYELTNRGWEFKAEKTIFEHELAMAMIACLKRRSII